MAKSINSEIAKKERAKQENKNPKARWFHAMPVVVNRALLELTEDGVFVKRVRLESPVGDITFKPKYKETETAYVSGMPTSKLTTYLVKLEDFIKQNPLLTVLNAEAKKSGGQEIVISYAEIDRYDEDEDEVITYKYTTKGLFDLIYFEAYHKTDMTCLEKMREIKSKFETKKVEA